MPITSAKHGALIANAQQKKPQGLDLLLAMEEAMGSETKTNFADMLARDNFKIKQAEPIALKEKPVTVEKVSDVRVREKPAQEAVKESNDPKKAEQGSPKLADEKSGQVGKNEGTAPQEIKTEAQGAKVKEDQQIPGLANSEQAAAVLVSNNVLPFSVWAGDITNPQSQMAGEQQELNAQIKSWIQEGRVEIKQTGPSMEASQIKAPVLGVVNTMIDQPEMTQNFSQTIQPAVVAQGGTPSTVGAGPSIPGEMTTLTMATDQGASATNKAPASSSTVSSSTIQQTPVSASVGGAAVAQPLTVVAIQQLNPVATDSQAEGVGQKLQGIEGVGGVQAKSAALAQAKKLEKPGTLTQAEKLQALQQVKDQLKSALKKGESHLSVHLKPYELGKVDIKLDISREGVVSAQFLAENRATLEALANRAQDLQQIFTDAGLSADLKNMNFTSSDQQSEEANKGSQLTNKEMTPDTTMDVAPARERIRTQSSALDIEV